MWETNWYAHRFCSGWCKCCQLFEWEKILFQQEVINLLVMNCQRSYLYERCAHLCKSWYRWTCMCGFSFCLISNVLSLSPALCILILNASRVEFGSALCFVHADCTTYSANCSFSFRMKSKWGRKKKNTTHLKFWSRFISIVTFQGWT